MPISHAYCTLHMRERNITVLHFHRSRDIPPYIALCRFQNIQIILWHGNMSCCCSNEYATYGQIDIRGFGFWGNYYSVSLLTHSGRVMHICVSKLTIVGSDNGLSPGRRQAIIWTNDGILLIGPLGADFSEILIEILTFSFKKMRFKLSSAKWRPFCLGLNGLIMVAVSYSLAVVAVLIVCNACICSVEALPTSQSISSPLTNLFGCMMTGTFISLYMYDNICNIYFQWSQILQSISESELWRIISWMEEICEQVHIL